jgi:hypothetical protein
MAIHNTSAKTAATQPRKQKARLDRTNGGNRQHTQLSKTNTGTSRKEHPNSGNDLLLVMKT